MTTEKTSYRRYKLTTKQGEVIFFPARDLVNAFDFARRYYDIESLVAAA